MEHETRTIASSFALSAFVLALIWGMSAGNPAYTVLFKAIVCMIVCQVVGSLAGMVATHAIREHLAEYRRAHPIPELSTDSQPSDQDLDEISAKQVEKSP